MVRTVNVYAASVGSRFGESSENFGDNLMHDLLDGLFGVKVRYVKHSAAELLGVGSILDSYYRRKRGNAVPLLSQRKWRTLHVWGSGFMDEHSSALWPQRLQYHAVRGPLTARRIAKPDIAQGDPALLLPLIWPGSKEKRLKIGVIPHFATLRTFRDRYENSLPKSWAVIDLLQHPRQICEMISACDAVISSSLHGLIVADAYNVPSLWTVPDSEIKGDGFKFRDFEAQRGVSLPASRGFDQVLLSGVREDNFSVAPPSSQTVDALIASFPFR